MQSLSSHLWNISCRYDSHRDVNDYRHVYGWYTMSRVNKKFWIPIILVILSPSIIYAAANALGLIAQ